MSNDYESEIVILHKKASSLQKRGDYDNAEYYFKKVLNIKNINPKFYSSSYYHLAQMSNKIEKKKEYYEKCLRIEDGHKKARLYFNSLNNSMIERIKNDKDNVLINFFGKYLLNIQIQTISACNASCVFCPYQTSWQKKNPGKMEDKTFNHILEVLEGIPLGKVCIYLENEPLLDKKIFDRISAIKKKLTYSVIEISSNISLLDAENIKKLYEVLHDTPHEVWISWHGLDKRQYEDIMGLDFEISKKNLLNYFKYTKGKLNTVINTIYGGKLHKDIKYSTKKDAENFFINLLKNSYEEFDEKSLKINAMLFHNRAEGFEMESKYSENEKKKLGILHPNCPRISEWLHFTYDGDLILCCMDYKKQTVMGNMNDFSTFEELLLSKPYNNIRAMALGKIETDSNFICKKCIGG